MSVLIAFPEHVLMHECWSKTCSDTLVRGRVCEEPCIKFFWMYPILSIVQSFFSRFGLSRNDAISACYRVQSTSLGGQAGLLGLSSGTV